MYAVLNQWFVAERKLPVCRAVQREVMVVYHAVQKRDALFCRFRPHQHRAAGDEIMVQQGSRGVLDVPKHVVFSNLRHAVGNQCSVAVDYKHVGKYKIRLRLLNLPV
ncbi:hypothetical protein SDC9_78895 [bioreactor metagenome]|uniref:Uncharacterized protein n=1 Tax=bioreactor metagenome TaxID=1076179 RepID=A0A644Z0S7_9ZZZZ